MEFSDIILIAVVLITASLVMVGKSRKPSQKNASSDAATYEMRQYLMTPAEYSFYRILKSVLPPNLTIMTKVRIADVVKPATNTPKKLWQRHFNWISAKHFDFLLCDVNTLVPVAAVELNDASHKRKDRQHRDDFVNHVCRTAGLPLGVYEAKRSYLAQDVKEQLIELLSTDITGITT